MKVLYFAQAADLARCREEEWDVHAPISLDAFWDEAVRRHPELSQIQSQCRVASGLEYAAPDGTLNPGEEAAIIPPVSGG